MNIIKIILSLIISGAIGYLTNYIAVKMMFRPRKEIRIKGIKIPFTPGIIPKNQSRLAKALGNTVGKQLFTDSDLKNSFKTDIIAKNIGEKISGEIYSDEKIETILSNICGNDNYDCVKQKINTELSQTVYNKIKSFDIASFIINEGASAIKEKISGSMIAMFVNDDIISSFTEPLRERINQYIDTDIKEKIEKSVNEETTKLSQKTPAQLLENISITKDYVSSSIEKLFNDFIADTLEPAISSVDIPSIVEAKVNAMNVAELEELVMSVMKNELNAVINLGAVIGIAIGIINVLVQNI